MSKKTNLSLNPYKGTRDFYPEDMFIRKYIFSVMRRAVEKFGYIEYDSSLLEETELYRAKTGEEIVNEQTYSFIDRGGRDVTIRPEMTPTVARMIARKRNEIIYPARWYSIPNLWRYERPQKGRLREHWQLNVDVFGIDSIEAEIEIISASDAIMKEFGAKEKDYTILLNSRKIMNWMFYDYLKLSEESAYSLSKLIDKKNKMEKEEFEEKLKEILGANSKFLIDFLNTEDMSSLPDELQKTDSVKNLLSVITKLKNKGINNVKFSPELMRGFDYYTDVIFEVFDNNPDNARSMFGGGRYNGLVSIFGVEPVSAVGFGMGDVTIRNFLEAHNLMPKYKPNTDVYICVISENEISFADKTANILRQNNINVYVNYEIRKIDKQIKQAEKLGINQFICIGDEEVKSGKITVKNLTEHKEQTESFENIYNIIKKEDTLC